MLIVFPLLEAQLMKTAKETVEWREKKASAADTNKLEDQKKRLSNVAPNGEETSSTEAVSVNKKNIK